MRACATASSPPFDGDHLAAPLREQAPDRVAGGRLVVDDQHARAAQIGIGAASGASACGLAGQRGGLECETTVPFPGTDSSAMR